jgi:hypothetical protein
MNKFVLDLATGILGAIPKISTHNENYSVVNK